MSISVKNTTGLDLIQHIPLDKFVQLSREIVNNLPSTNLPQTIVPDEYGLKIHEFTLAAETLIDIWKQIDSILINEDDLINQLKSLQFNHEYIKSIIDIWNTKTSKKVDSSVVESNNKIPEFKSLNWGILLERSNTYEPKKREIKAMMTIDTSDGQKYTKLNVDELKKLHYELQDLQNQLDYTSKSM